jgi:hypothetical protein
MDVDSQIDPHEAERLARELNRVAQSDAALLDSELEILENAVEFIEDAAGIQYGEKTMESPTTGEEYRVTKWIEAGDGQVIALQKEAVEGSSR